MVFDGYGLKTTLVSLHFMLNSRLNAIQSDAGLQTCGRISVSRVSTAHLAVTLTNDKLIVLGDDNKKAKAWARLDGPVTFSSQCKSNR